jgi:signal transduction histidine kinase
VGDPARRPVARPRIRRRLRLIAAGLVLLPTLALLLLLKAMADIESRASDREGEARRAELEARVEALAGELEGVLAPPPRERFTLREGAPPGALREPVEIDARCDDWRVDGLVDPEPCEEVGPLFDRVEWLAEHREGYDPRDFSLRVRTAVRDDQLFVFLRVTDDEVIVRQRDLDDSDQLRLAVALPAEGGALLPVRFVTVLEPGAEGDVVTRQVTRSWRREAAPRDRLPWGEAALSEARRPLGRWRPTGDGYQIELRLPLRTLGAGWREAQLGLAVLDVDRRGAKRQAIWVAPQVEGAVAWEAPGAAAFRKRWPEPGVTLEDREVAVLDARGRELFSSFEGDEAVREQAARGLAAWRGDEGEGAGAPAAVDALALAAVRDARGDLAGFVLEREPRPSAGRRLAALVEESTTTAAILAGTLVLLFVLLAYTRSLSRRILSLTDDVVREHDADDEIGELSRRITELMERDRAHRDYLEQLPRILGHETLGPLGVVKMFIDDLDEPDPDDAKGRRERARRAIQSIEGLIEDLREATSLEEALEQGERVEVDLAEVVRDCVRMSRDTRPGPLAVDLPDGPVRAEVIERRIEQLLDKLLDNAADFSGGAPVEVSLVREGGEARLRVANRGAPLPDGPAAEQLFSPMWSGRKRTSRRHLGLGLYVVRVIAEAHGGRVRAWNDDDGRVVFEVTLPVAS